MSIAPNTLKVKDPQSLRDAQFDWTSYLGIATIVSQSITITGADSALAADNVVLAAGNQKVNYRLTGGTRGVLYTVTCRITTNESPAQTDDRSITVLIQDL